MKHLYIGVIILLLASISLKAQLSTCPGGAIKFISNVTGNNYQWQLETDSGHISVMAGSHYLGENTKELQILNIPSYWSGLKFRCLVDGNYSVQFTISISNEWKGSIDSLWENGVNWSCGTIPDIYTNVTINNTSINPLIINSNVSCKTITLNPQAILKVNPNFTMQVSELPPSESLSDEFQDILAKASAVYKPLDSLLMANGKSVSAFLKENGLGRPILGSIQQDVPNNTNGKQKDIFLARMIKQGDYLMNDENFDYQNNKPSQNGLAYNYGVKSHTIPMQPTLGECKDEGEKYYSLDCSGFVYQMTVAAALPAVVENPIGYFSVANMTDTAKWNNAFRKSEYDRLTMVEYSGKEIPKESLEFGDLILWNNHVAMAVRTFTNRLLLYQCNGSDKKEMCKDGTNRGENYGPNIKDLDAVSGLFFSGKYRVFRVVEGLYDNRDNQKYLAKKIGKQIWMERNFNYAYPGTYCYENSQENCAIYGRLYDWNQAKSSVPVGWHLPSDQEWGDLVTFLGGDLSAGAKLKDIGTTFWISPNKGATNGSGFNGLPAGNRNTFGTNFANIGIRGFWWSSTINSSNTAQAFNRVLNNESTTVGRGSANRADGRTHFSVRLIKDN